MVEVIFIILFLLAVLVFVFFFTRGNLSVPGPHGAFVVLQHFLNRNIDLVSGSNTRRKTYGDIVGIYIHRGKFILELHGYNTIKEAFVTHGDVFADRADIFLTKYVAEHNGIVAGNGASWKEHRLFALREFTNLGLKKSGLEQMVHREVYKLEKKIKKQNGKPFNIRNDFFYGLVEIMKQMTVGKESMSFKKFVDIIVRHFDTSMGWIANGFPAARHIPGDPFGLMKFINESRINRGSFITQLRTVKNNEGVSIVKSYYEDMENRQTIGKDTTKNERQLFSTVVNFFAAGIQSKTAALRWAILHLIKNPDVQQKMYDEIESMIGISRLPTVDDRHILTYCEATVMEVLRISNIFPFGGPRQTNKDIFFRGYFIPKGTRVVANFSSVLHDPKVFPNPEKFSPSRFLTEEGKIHKPEEFIPFSIGKRVCVGENFARSELFIILTSLVQKFEFCWPVNTEVATEVFVSAAERSPMPFDIIANYRH